MYKSLACGPSSSHKVPKILIIPRDHAVEHWDNKLIQLCADVILIKHMVSVDVLQCGDKIFL